MMFSTSKSVEHIHKPALDSLYISTTVRKQNWFYLTSLKFSKHDAVPVIIQTEVNGIFLGVNFDVESLLRCLSVAIKMFSV